MGEISRKFCKKCTNYSSSIFGDFCENIQKGLKKFLESFETFYKKFKEILRKYCSSV